MEKVIRDGKVAVIISPGFGAGWYTWNKDHKELLFHPKVVEMIETNNRSDIDDEWVEEHLGIKDIYTGGYCDLTIEWVEEGVEFIIEEYDGNESLTIIEDLDTHTA